MLNETRPAKNTIDMLAEKATLLADDLLLLTTSDKKSPTKRAVDDLLEEDCLQIEKDVKAASFCEGQS